MAIFDLAQTDTLLTTTRAVRKRLDLERPVDRQTILDCIDIAQQAPNGGNRQPWHWVVVTDEEQRRAVAEVYDDASRDYLAAPASHDTPDDYTQAALLPVAWTVGTDFRRADRAPVESIVSFDRW